MGVFVFFILSYLGNNDEHKADALPHFNHDGVINEAFWPFGHSEDSTTEEEEELNSGYISGGVGGHVEAGVGRNLPRWG